MKSPWFETTTGALQALLSSRQYVFATLYTIQPVVGSASYYTSADFDISIGSTTWVHDGPYFDVKSANEANGHWKIGLDVDTWQISLLPKFTDAVTGASDPDLLLNQPWAQAVKNGSLDGATVIVDRVYAAALPQAGQAFSPVGAVTIFKGIVADVTFGRTSIAIALDSFLQLLQNQYPIHYFQAACRHTLFDAGCTLLASTYTKSSTVASVPGSNTFTSTIAAPGGSNTYALGRVTFTSGANTGIWRSVRSWDGTTFTLLKPFPYPIEIGDAFNAIAGCDKTLTTCNLFSNQINFGGQPYIPSATVALGAPQ